MIPHKRSFTEFGKPPEVLTRQKSPTEGPKDLTFLQDRSTGKLRSELVTLSEDIYRAYWPETLSGALTHRRASLRAAYRS